ncbi:unnamed protein product [Linum tenue]|uniref:DYW domain-containing protein n=1 Tax=Linum tenue TaxID=586396 RepID=A0AAV0MUK7_9ROSI|nr:unnamed protein product [Linum tenue]
MYTRCGVVQEARLVFEKMVERNVISWNSMLSGYTQNGQVLSACSHAGLVNEGRQCFDEMQKLSVAPEAKHYACVVDMLGRAGKLQEALDLIKQMPFPPNDAVWGALLLACKIHGNKELGQIAADKLFELQPGHTGYYVLMSNIYAASQRWGEVGNLRQYMKNKGMKKPAAFSVIEFGEEIHGFHTADREHPYWEEVYREVEILAVKLKMAGHVPDLSCTLHDMEEEDKELALNLHSEKLAVAFGIMRTESGMTIYLTKNLRVCNDCHSALKFLSHIFDREIVVRDGNRFHHFKGGVCSCNDYW